MLMYGTSPKLQFYAKVDGIPITDFNTPEALLTYNCVLFPQANSVVLKYNTKDQIFAIGFYPPPPYIPFQRSLEVIIANVGTTSATVQFVGVKYWLVNGEIVEEV